MSTVLYIVQYIIKSLTGGLSTQILGIMPEFPADEELDFWTSPYHDYLFILHTAETDGVVRLNVQYKMIDLLYYNIPNLEEEL